VAIQRPALTLFVLLLPVACASNRSPEIRASAQAASASEVLVDKHLREAQALWRSEGPENYTVTVRYSEFAGEFGCRTQTFRVAGAKVKSLNLSKCGARADKMGSVPALFSLASELLDRRMGESSATFDPVYGYPRKFYVGHPEIEDAYFSFEVVAFSPEDRR
jgi:hypothetical protein